MDWIHKGYVWVYLRSYGTSYVCVFVRKGYTHMILIILMFKDVNTISFYFIKTYFIVPFPVRISCNMFVFSNQDDIDFRIRMRHGCFL